eukprot:TRINITY_DN1906_c0_g1_i2.p1 TRINITY_DN1906_c0_g1~~TRINITY_DN1906_c0_g1_i2.p1  ORF type:complete len:117 (+),score=7.38 TRINITY_DN1906_c0_g1_i2:290-640(+)
MTNLYNWNVKQIFLYMTVSFEHDFGGKNSTKSVITVWDSILPRWETKRSKTTWVMRNRHKYKFENEAIEYPIRDVYHTLKGKTVTVSLKAEVMPIIGHIFSVHLHNTTLALPNKYV